ncbi:MAG TPA: RNA methyltransferase [Solirubrobacterales bacterium]|nr:RNA methyltransferase [Solirubrobacterales bacterium]
MTIQSKDNEKLKLVRKLRERKHREREGLFATEGEDLLEAGLAAGAAPRFVLVAAGSPPHDFSTVWRGKPVRGVEEVAPELLASVSSLGSGTRAIAVWPRPEEAPLVAPCVYLDAVGDPGNVGTIVRTAHALLDATVVLGPGCADPFGPKATRAGMGSSFARPPVVVAGVEATPEPRVALVAHGGDGLDALTGAATLCLGAERDGLRPEVVAACAASVTIPMRGGAESLNVAAAAAVACARMSEAPTDA